MKNTSRRTFGKQLTGAIAVLPLTPLIAAAQKSKDKDDEGSPIIVGGGGGGTLVEKDKTRYKNRCRFKKGNADYMDPAPTDHKKKPFTHPGWRIQTFKISIAAGTLDYSYLLLASGNCTIEIECDSNDDDVTIFHNANVMGIEMNSRTYQTTTADTYENNDLYSFVKRVELTRDGRKKVWQFDDDDRAKVCVDWKQNSTMTCAL